jgi:hypothetical protein
MNNKKIIYLVSIVALLVVFFLAAFGIMRKLKNNNPTQANNNVATQNKTGSSSGNTEQGKLTPPTAIVQQPEDKANIPASEKTTTISGLIVSIGNGVLKLKIGSDEKQLKVTANTKFYVFENNAPVLNNQSAAKAGSPALVEYNNETTELTSVTVK